MVPRQVEIMPSMASESSLGPKSPVVDEDLKHSRDQILSTAHEAVQAAFKSTDESTENPVPEPELVQKKMVVSTEAHVADVDDTDEAAVGDLFKSAVAGVAAGPDEALGTATEKVRRLRQCRSINTVLTVAG